MPLYSPEMEFTDNKARLPTWFKKLIYCLHCNIREIKRKWLVTKECINSQRWGTALLEEGGKHSDTFSYFYGVSLDLRDWKGPNALMVLEAKNIYDIGKWYKNYYKD